MANWLITVDHSEFKLDEAYDTLSEIYWKNDVQNANKGLQVNDIVYIYVTQPVAQIMYQFQVVGHANNSAYPITQKDFWVDRNDINAYLGQYAILKAISKLDKNKTSLSRRFLIEQGFIKASDTLQGRRTDRAKSADDPIKTLFDHIAEQFNSNLNTVNYPDEADPLNPKFFEGAKKTVQVNKYERSAEARAACIKKHGVNCKICEMNFEKTYGSFAKDFIHVHHIIAVSKMTSEYQIDPEKDLIPVCPNCHAMLHKQINGIDMTVEQLKQFYQYSAQQIS